MAQPIELFAQYVAELLADSCAMVTERPNVEWAVETGLGLGEEEDTLWWSQRFTPDPNLWVLIGAPEEVWRELGARVSEDGATEDVRQRYLALVQQLVSSLAQILAAETNQAFTCAEGEETAEPPPLPLRLKLSCRFGGATVAPLWIGCPSSFLTAIHALLQPAPPPAPAPPAPPQPDPAAAPPTATPVERIKALAGVDMPISVSFGKATLPLKEVLKLSVGSIVELNRTPAEPVDVVVNNHVIARGEVVIVEGNYGVRVTEVIGQQERINSFA